MSDIAEAAQRAPEALEEAFALAGNDWCAAAHILVLSLIETQIKLDRARSLISRGFVRADISPQQEST